MSLKNLFRIGILVLLLIGSWFGWTVLAQDSCPYASLRLETGLPLDPGPICQAAEPWSAKGVRVFVLVTDFAPASEAAWFDYLDQVEAEAGLRDLKQADSFARDALALETTTANVSWGQAVTLGENLWDGPLDTDAAVAQVKNELRTGLATGDPTRAVVDALGQAYTTAYPPPSPWLWLGAGILGLGVLGGGAAVAYPTVVRPALARRRREQELQAHLADLRTRTSNLMGACDRLLDGETPTDTVLYQLFSAYGGEQDDQLTGQVQERLTLAQNALREIFSLRQKMIDPTVQAQRSLEEQVRDWETLYLSLAGSSEAVHSLSEEELRALLDPLVILDRETSRQPDDRLSGQLAALRQELTDAPLKVEPQLVDPTQVDTLGVLGHLDEIEETLAFLQDAEQDAPEALAAAEADRKDLAGRVSTDFFLPAETLFGGIDEQLTQVRTAIAASRFVVGWQQAEGVMDDLDVVEAVLETTATYRARQSDLEAITGLGYRPPRLNEDLAELDSDLAGLEAAIEAGDYAAAQPWLDELALDSERALNAAQTWQALAQKNETALTELKTEYERLVAYQADQAEPAWSGLQAYPQENWRDISAGRAQSSAILQDFEQQLAQIERLNGLEEQQFEQAGQVLAQVTAQLNQADLGLRDVTNRLAEVQEAEKHIESGLNQAEADLHRAEQLRDREDRKIGPEVDRQLQEAREKLQEGRRLSQVRHFTAAIAAQTAARELAGRAYEAAEQQVQEINRLQDTLQSLPDIVSARIQEAERQAQSLPTVARTDQTHQLLRDLADGLSQARRHQHRSADLEDRAWAEALQAAVTAYQAVQHQADQAQERINADRSAYEALQQQLRDAIREAQRQITQAERRVKQRDARKAGEPALQRARSLLPDQPRGEETIPTLERRLQQAQATQEAAKLAEQQADQAIAAAEAARRRRTSSGSGPIIMMPSSRSGSSWSSSSRRSSSSRSSSSSSSRRSSYRSSSSSSRRSSSGSSRRSSSMGRSRRR